MDDFCDFIHQYRETKELPLKKVRAMVHFVIYGMWGKSNNWALKGELEVLEMLGFAYDGNRMCNGSVQKRKQRGGFCKTLIVKKLDMERSKVNDAWERCFGEKFFSRDVFKVPMPTESVADAGTKKLPEKSHLRKYIVYCKSDTDGFDGSYILAEGNKRRREIDGLEEVMSKEHKEAQTKEHLIAQFTDEIRKRDLASIVLDPASIMKFLRMNKCSVPTDIALQKCPKRAKTNNNNSTFAKSTLTVTDEDVNKFESPMGVRCAFGKNILIDPSLSYRFLLRFPVL